MKKLLPFLFLFFLTACSVQAPTDEVEVGTVQDKTDLIVLTSPLPGETIEFPLTISGRARGYWFFEASFPVALKDAKGNVFYETYAEADGDWMTEDFVDFTATLTPPLVNAGKGQIVLKHSNASGLPERDDQLVVPVTFVKKQTQAIEQFPSELSLEYFSTMNLEGTDFTLGDVLSSNADYTRYTVTYRSNGLLISGILNIPKGDGPFPLIVMNHGYIDRAVYTNGRGLKREQDFFARNGYVVLHSDYRGHALSDPSPLPDDTAIYDAGIEYSMDVVNGISALRSAALPQVDASKVFMLGHSLGGGVSMNIAVAYPDLIDGLILYAPVHIDAYENFYRWRDMRLEVHNTEKVIGSRDSDKQFWDDISSLSMISRLKAPVLLFQGTEDTDVPPAWAEFLAEELRENDKEMEYILYDGEKHEFIAKFPDFMKKSLDFTQKIAQSSSTISIYDKQRISKKPFGLYVSPKSSPVSPEKFTGYHAGVDFEILPLEKPHNVSVTALCSGDVHYTNWVKGYGGVLVQSCVLDGEDITVLYGHLAEDSIPYVRGNDIEKGEFVGTLGIAYSTETDNERAHLHLSVHKGTDVELRGYTENQQDLDNWLDPSELTARL